MLVVLLVACTTPLEVLTTRDAGLDGGSDGGSAPGAVFAMAAGDAHVCVIRGGALWCWGANDDGQLGFGATSPALVPVALDAGAAWVQVSAGEVHTCALDSAGAAWCWGGNGAGQLGLSDTQPRWVPTRVPLPVAVSQLRCGLDFTCAVGVDASLWCWGANFEGQLGRADDFPGQDQPTPAPVTVTADAGWVQVAAGQGHACAVRVDGSLWCWGRNSRSTLGLGDDAGVQYRSPQRVGASTGWRTVDVNQEFSCALSSTGALWCFGALPLASSITTSPTLVLPGPWASVRSNVFHACALSIGGEPTCWGRNLEGQLGLGDRVDRPTPLVVPGAPVTDLAVGRFFTCQRRANGTVLCTGQNGRGQLGVGDIVDRDAWVLVGF